MGRSVSTKRLQFCLSVWSFLSSYSFLNSLWIIPLQVSAGLPPIPLSHGDDSWRLFLFSLKCNQSKSISPCYLSPFRRLIHSFRYFNISYPVWSEKFKKLFLRLYQQILKLHITTIQNNEISHIQKYSNEVSHYSKYW